MGIVADLKRTKLWDVYDRHVLQLDPILAQMSAAGMPIDQTARRAFAEDLQQELEQIDAQLQQLIPDQLRPRQPKDGYLRDPPSIEGLSRIVVDGAMVVRCSSCGHLRPTRTHFKPKKRSTNPCIGSAAVRTFEGVERWAKLLPWVPSPKGILGYAHWRGHKVPTTRAAKGGRRETTDEKALEELRRNYPDDPLYPLVLKRRELATLAERYVGSPTPNGCCGGFAVGRDHCVHTQFTHTPSTLRLASEGPNLQNVPRPESELGRRFRDLFRAPSGWIFVARDFAGIEAILVGIECASGRYVRLARLGVHDFFNAHLLRSRSLLSDADVPQLSWSDDDLRECFGSLKKRFGAERQIAKRCVHASNYRVTPFKMWHEYPDTFASEGHAHEIQRAYFELFPEIPEWHERICRQVDRTGHCRNAFGYVHRFHRVIPWERMDKGWQWKTYRRGPLTGQLVYEEDAKRLIAFLPQSGAAGIMKESLLAFKAQYPALMPYLRLTIHDELLGMCPKAAQEEFAAALKSVMEAPRPQYPLPQEWGLGPQLTVLTELKVGETWGNLA